MSLHSFLILFVLPLLLGACAAPAGRGGAAKGGHGFRVEHNVIYTPKGWPKALPANIYVPDSTGRRPAVLLVHGGSWRTWDKRWYMTPIAHDLVRRGYVVMNVSYRGAPAWTYPAPVEDLQEAVKWLRRHADEYHIRPERIGVYGYSAGAQLAAQLGTLDGPRGVRVQAVVAGGTPSDLRLYPGGRLVPSYLGGNLMRVPEVFCEASPVTHVTPDDPPFFIYHGTRDMIVPPIHAIILDEVLSDAGVPHDLWWVKNRGHIMTFLFPGEAVTRAIDFLDDVLKGEERKSAARPLPPTSETPA
ncbi:MAG TPA: alpha/beta hydrolase [Verrucomicrobiales bacterium]|jgi:acetyl esterase/lipase|nr:alpha/beta hydrolase [Verrucomicrobiales bacterium]